MPSLRIVQANAVYDPAIKTASALLDLYHTLTEWSVAVAAAGATVSVVQRFHTAARVERDGVPYEFVNDTQAPWLSTKDAPEPFVGRDCGSSSPDVVHVNGLIFPATRGGDPQGRRQSRGDCGATSWRRVSGSRIRAGRHLAPCAVEARADRRGRDLLHRARTG